MRGIYDFGNFFMPYSRAEEFEFQWWDHVFNKAAKTVKVEEGEGGEVKVIYSWVETSLY